MIVELDSAHLEIPGVPARVTANLSYRKIPATWRKAQEALILAFAWPQRGIFAGEMERALATQLDLPRFHFRLAGYQERGGDCQSFCIILQTGSS